MHSGADVGCVNEEDSRTSVKKPPFMTKGGHQIAKENTPGLFLGGPPVTTHQLRHRVRRARVLLDEGGAMRKADVASLVGVTTRTLDNWIAAGTFPRPDLRFSARTLKWSAELVRKHLMHR